MIVLKVLLCVVLVVVTAGVLFLSFALWSMFVGRAVPPAEPNTLKVACVGDSITYGDLFSARKRYPPRLAELLGPSYAVRNFGASGHTLQKAGDHPYWKHRYFRLSTEFRPDVVVIMLGTNDSKTQNWAGAGRYEEDLRALIAHYRALQPSPRIILATPPSAFPSQKNRRLPWQLQVEPIADIAASVRRIAAELGLAVADVHAATASHPEMFRFDGVHPGAAGSRLIAETIHRAIAVHPPG